MEERVSLHTSGRGRTAEGGGGERERKRKREREIKKENALLPTMLQLGSILQRKPKEKVGVPEDGVHLMGRIKLKLEAKRDPLRHADQDVLEAPH